MYAIIRTGGKQYRVEANRNIRVEKIGGEAGSRMALNEVMMIGGDNAVIGTPTVQGAVVNVEVVEQTRNDTVLIFKKIRRHNYRRKNGHRQPMTVLKVLEILRPGQVSGLSAKAEVVAKTEVAVEAKKPVVKKAAAKVQKDESVSVQSDQAE
jgi:large subunit ribosomal protein L21